MVNINYAISSIEKRFDFDFTGSTSNLNQNKISPNNITLKLLSNPQNTKFQRFLKALKFTAKVILAPISLPVYLLSRFAALQGIGNEEARVVNEIKRAKLLAENGEAIKFGLEGESVLEGMYFTAEPPIKNAKTILLCTGSHLSYENYALPMVKALKSMGHNVMVFNYEGFGKSEGVCSEQGVYRSVEAAYQYLKQEKNCLDQSIVAWGYSLGSGAVSDLGTKHSVDIVIDRGFSSMSQVAYNAAPDFLKTIAKIIFIVGARFNNLSKLKKVQGKVFIAQGSADMMMNDADHGQKLNSAVCKNKSVTFRSVNSTHKHTDSSVWFSKGEDRAAIEKFLA